MIASLPESLNEQVLNFKRWASSLPVPHHGEWESDYAEWPALWSAAKSVLKSVPAVDWTEACIANLVYAIARDNSAELIMDALPGNPDAALKLARFAADSSEADAKWQLATQLGTLSAHKQDAEAILLRMVDDESEYVRRRSLLALGILKSRHAEALAEKAWLTGHEYQRTAALAALKDLNSAKLGDYIKKATEDGRPFVVQAAREAGDV